MKRGDARAVGCLLVAFVVVLAAVLGAVVWIRGRSGDDGPALGAERCVATAGGQSVALDLEQAELTSIIVGLSVRRGLPARAASVAMATVYQETQIRNLDYGDRDSVGLFQQRPSQGWGSVKQLMDPYYATNKFYDALVKVENWQTDEINDVAQKVQRSGFPEAYRDHEADAKVLASTLTGHSPRGFTCLERQGSAGRAAALVKSMTKTYRTVPARRDGSQIRIAAKTETSAWAFAHYAVANAGAYGVIEVRVGDRRWQTQEIDLPTWSSAATPKQSDTTVTITVRG